MSYFMPIDLREVLTRLRAAANEMVGSKLEQDKQTGLPTEQEWQRASAILRSHGLVVDRDLLHWDSSTLTWDIRL